MSDPEVPQNDQPNDIDDVVGSANEGLDAAAAARADVPARTERADAEDASAEADIVRDRADDTSAEPRVTAEPHVADAEPRAAGVHDTSARTDAAHDPDLEAFAAAEREHPGTFASSGAPVTSERVDRQDAETAATTRIHSSRDDVAADEHVRPTVADEAYTTTATPATAAETQVVPAEPTAPPAAPQPIFVQAPEPPRDLGNRGTAGAIGLVATIAFAILYLGATVGLGLLFNGVNDVTGDSVVDAILAPLSTWSFWVPVVVFFFSFWLLGAFINRARWGKWVIFGLLVGVATWGGHILGQLFQAPFWQITATESTELVQKQMLAPLAIAAFVFARELTIWFGAWVARSGAKKKALNAEAQAEYERTLEAGPAALR